MARAWENATYALCGALADELARSGVTHAALCPGSRSAPLALALWREPRIRVLTHLDERSAAYLALGIGRATGRPAVVVGTSGTAVANFFPAVEEARNGRVPLLLITADRPPELRDTGALQTIDQVHLYGRAVRWFAELPVPEVRADVFRRTRALTDRAVAEALGSPVAPAGPVHLNVPLREPLVPVAVTGERVPDAEERASEAFAGRGDGRPFLTVRTGGGADATAGSRPMPQMGSTELTGRRGVILIGPVDPRDLGTGDLGRAACRLGEALGWPVLADPLSGLRTAGGSGATSGRVVTGYDVIARALEDPDQAALAGRLRPEIAIVLGAAPVSKATAQLVASLPDRILVARGTPQGLTDPAQTASEALFGDPVEVAARLAVRSESAGLGAGSTWRADWEAADGIVGEVLRQGLYDLGPGEDGLFEGNVAATLSRHLPAGSTLFVGNSMPIRDVDSFVGLSSDATAKGLRILANRGVSGIDGVVSSAFGAVAAGPDSGTTALLIGDLSFLHDANGLLSARMHGLSLLVVLVENDGGGIFSFLPQARLPAPEFEPLFGVPLGMDPEPLVKMMGGRFCRVSTRAAFEEALGRDLGRPGLRVIACRVPDRARNVRMHEAIWERARKALEDWARASLPNVRGEQGSTALPTPALRPGRSVGSHAG